MELEEDFEQEEQLYRESPRNAFNSRLRRQGEVIFNDSFGTDIDFEEVREEFKNIEALQEIASTEVKKPSFPFITMYVALVLDVLGIADFTGFGYFIMVVVEIIFSIVLLILMFRKTDSMFKIKSQVLFRGSRISGSRKRGKSIAQKGLNNFARKYLRKFMTRRMAAILIVKIIPVVGILASNAFFVYLAHNKQTKIAKNYMALITAVGKVLDRHERMNR